MPKWVEFKDKKTGEALGTLEDCYQKLLEADAAAETLMEVQALRRLRAVVRLKIFLSRKRANELEQKLCDIIEENQEMKGDKNTDKKRKAKIREAAEKEKEKLEELRDCVDKFERLEEDFGENWEKEVAALKSAAMKD